jgi:hypothetical protein
MTTQRRDLATTTLLEFVASQTRAMLLACQVEPERAEALAEDLEAAIREHFGTRTIYVHSVDLAKRNARIWADWNAELAHNAKSGHPRSMADIRDGICRRYGIKRRTFSQVISDIANRARQNSA